MTRIVYNYDMPPELIEMYGLQPDLTVHTLQELAEASKMHNGLIHVSVFIESSATWPQSDWNELLQMPMEGLHFYTNNQCLCKYLLTVQANVLYIPNAAFSIQHAVESARYVSPLLSLQRLKTRSIKSYYPITSSDLIYTSQTIESVQKLAHSKIQDGASKKVPKVKSTNAKELKVSAPKQKKPKTPREADVQANLQSETEGIKILENVRAEEGKIDAQGKVTQLQQEDSVVLNPHKAGKIGLPKTSAGGHQSNAFGHLEVALSEDALSGLIDNTPDDIIAINSGLITAPLKQAKDILAKLIPTTEKSKDKSRKSSIGTKGLTLGNLSMERIATEDDLSKEFGNSADGIQLDRTQYHVLTYASPIEYLIGEGILPRELKLQLTEIQAKLKREKHIDVAIEDILVMNGILTEEAVLKAMSRVYNVEVLSSKYLTARPVLTNVYPRQVCKKYVFLHTTEGPRELIGVYGNKLQSNLGTNFGSARVRFALATSILARIDAEEVWQYEGIGVPSK